MTQARQAHHQPSTEDLGVKQPSFIRKQLHLCSTGLNNLAELYDELRIMAAPVEQRELPAGARERFFQAVARSAATGSKEAITQVASIASAGERRNDRADVAARAAILPMVAGPATASAQQKGPVLKKSLLPVDRQLLEIPAVAANSKSKFEPAVASASNAIAARMTGIF